MTLNTIPGYQRSNEGMEAAAGMQHMCAARQSFAATISSGPSASPSTPKGQKLG